MLEIDKKNEINLLWRKVTREKKDIVLKMREKWKSA
jgi:ADP-heptose:LPS heptosyltransferase